MNQPYFGAYQSGFQTLPKNAYEMMTAPTKQNAETIGKVASGIGGIAQNYMTGLANDKAFEQGAAAQYKGLESISQATGVPVNAELANQYLNIGQMSPQQQAAFQNSLGQEAQRIQSLYNIGNQQRQASLQQMGRGVSAGLSTVPPPDPSRYIGVHSAGVVPAMPQAATGVSLPLPQYDTGPRVNFPQYQRGF